MSRFISFSPFITIVFTAVLLTSCSGLGFIGGGKKETQPNKLDGLVPISSGKLSTTKDVRVDVVEVLMSDNDIRVLKQYIAKLTVGEEKNWVNKDTGNAFTVRAIEKKPEDNKGSRKIVVWGKKKEATRTMVMTYRYYF